MPAWPLAFLTSLALALATTPLFRRLAIRTSFVDIPDTRKGHRRPIPYLGGIGLMGSALIGLTLQSRLSPRVGVIALAAAMLATIGLLDDHRSLGASSRFAAQIVAAVAAVAVGLRIHATGVDTLDGALTIIWIVGVTNAFNLLDNMDGLAAGVATGAGAAVFALAIMGEQPVVATLAAALVGACLGFLVYNRRPASIFMGDAGSLFLGYILAVLTIDVSPGVDPPFSFVVPLIILGLPVLDTTTVTLSRLRRGRPVSEGGQDHLSHRLVKRGLSKRRAVNLLISTEAMLAALAVLGGRHVIKLYMAAAAAAAILAMLSVATARAPVHLDLVVGFPRRMKLALLAVALGVPLVSAPALIALARALGPARDGQTAARLAVDSVGKGDAAYTAARFQEARESFTVAQGRLNGPLVSLGLGVPGLASNLNASRSLVAEGRSLSVVGTDLARIADGARVRVQGGAVPIDEIRAVAPTLAQAEAALRHARQTVADIDTPFLLPPLADAVKTLEVRVNREMRTVERASASADLLPAILGADRPRRYFLAFQNNSEIRGAGGFIGNWGELVSEGGNLRLARFGRTQELNDAGTHPRRTDMPAEFLDRWRQFNPVEFWQQINVSPDFPTTGRLIAGIYPQSGGEPVDGVIAVDPKGLAALLDLTGPISVPKWPEPISSANVVDITLKAAYVAFPSDEERIEFLGDVARRVAQAFTSVDLGDPPRLAAALSRATRDGNLVVYMTNPAEQRLVAMLGADGAVPAVRGDSILVVNQNLAANKVDVYLRRKVTYDVTLRPSGRDANLQGRVAVTLTNEAPATGLPASVIGPYDNRFQAGENRTYVSVYSPFGKRSATLEGRRTELESHKELDRRVESATLGLQSGQSQTLQIDVAGRIRLAAGGWYRLDLLHQTALRPDDVKFSLNVPPGWRVTETVGAGATGSRAVSGSFQLDRRHTIWVRVEREGTARVWEKLVTRP